MPRNVEIKARAPNLDILKRKAKELANDEGTTIIQEDTFFNVSNGRLKLRNIQGHKSQLISYCRPDQEGPKLSDFHFAQVADYEEMKTVLSHSLGVQGVVKKNRLLVLHGQTRIHLDQVDNLGSFVELEVMLTDDQTTEDGEAIAREIMSLLDICQSDLVDCAYMDLILKDNNNKKA